MKYGSNDYWIMFWFFEERDRNFTYTAHWWTDTEGSLAAAVEEMRPGYDQLMVPVIDNIPVLILVYLITIPLAILAIRLAKK